MRRAAELNQRPISPLEAYHDGPLPQVGSFVSVDREMRAGFGQCESILDILDSPFSSRNNETPRLAGSGLLR